MILGSKRCDTCHSHYDWVGSLKNTADEKMRQLIFSNRTLVFARFIQQDELSQYRITTRCPFCKNKNECLYTYTENKPA
jgi:hypothetical protein